MHEFLWSSPDPLEAEGSYYRGRSTARAASASRAALVTAMAEPGLPEWETEGGSLASTSHRPLGPAKRAARAPQDTSEGCLAMAAADMARAALEAEGWARIKFEHSAVAWSRRAKLLEAAETRAAVALGRART